MPTPPQIHPTTELSLGDKALIDDGMIRPDASVWTETRNDSG
jgi:hypothetical protein